MFSINKYSSQDIFNWKNTNVICLYIKIENNILTYKRINNNYIERAESIISMIKDTLNRYKIKNVEIYINLMDMPINNPYFLQFSNTTNCKINTIPNFSFYGASIAGVVSNLMSLIFGIIILNKIIGGK